MKLQVPFVQLPLAFDADRLAAEISALGEDAWKPHPQGYPGNDALSLISVDGDPASDAIAGPMRPTPLLLRCPYLMQTLDAIGAVWGRSRLMRLSGHAEVTPHADVNYYWRERMRVHVPILTQPTVRFMCGDDEINMAAGECWIFDTWRLHRVINDATRARVHLVADTVGGERFWQHASRGRVRGQVTPGWQPMRIEPDPAAKPELRYETVNVPTVMSPWEIREHVNFLMGEALPHPELPFLQQVATRFGSLWQALWSEYGDSRAGWREYRAVLDAFADDVQRYGADITFRNGNKLPFTMAAMVFRVALADRDEDTGAEIRGQQPMRTTGSKGDPEFDRPVFIVSPPRSGSTLLFETLAKTPDVYTIGEESHVHIEGVPALHPANRGFDSNRLDAKNATPDVIAALRSRFYESLRDHRGTRASGRVRMLEKTPKNALRIPFLAKVFPEARFVYLHRDPRPVLSSMLEAWRSGTFRTYPQLPGWPGPDWSLVLVPDWRSLAGKPLIEIVARQWEATTRILLDDLDAIPAERRTSIRYDALVADPQGEIERLGAELGFDAVPELSSLPLSRYTLSAPDPEKWRRHEQEIESVWPLIAATAARAERAAEKQRAYAANE